MEVKLYINTSDNRYINKTLTDEKIYSNVVIKQESDSYKPTIRITTTDNLSIHNYCYIARYGRYYYITNCTVYPNNVWEIELKCDVLMTYKPSLLNTEMVLERGANDYNLYMDDNKWFVNCQKQRKVINFNSSFSGATDELIMTVIGGV